jgi:hypothetical protein
MSGTVYEHVRGLPLRYEVVQSRGDGSLRRFKRRMRTLKRRLHQLYGQQVEIVRYEGSVAERNLRCVLGRFA